MITNLDPSWGQTLAEEFSKPYFAELDRFVSSAYASETCYPPLDLVFEAFRRTPFDKVKVVILGQDPYHGPGQAHGLSFSVRPGIPPPPSLVNIYKELEVEFGVAIDRAKGDLSSWADQGVLLLNATLTVADGKPGSHHKHGWERFTDAVVRMLSSEREHLVFLLWGSPAKKKGAEIDRARHLVLEAAHPSPLSVYRGFFGCGHFAQANEYLKSNGLEPIDWQPR